MTNVEYAKPDLVIQSGERPPDWAELAPCPNCGSMPHEAPEGVNRAGDPIWVHPHCWKCGHRPGINVAVDVRVMREQFEAFRQFVKENTPNHPTLNASNDPNVVADLQFRMAQLEQELAASRGQQPMAPATETVSGEQWAPPGGNG